MGGGPSYNLNNLPRRIQTATLTNSSIFEYQNSFNGGQKMVIHPSLDPKRLNKAGLNIRESRDIDSKESTAISILWDGTGSMRTHPKMFANKLTKLMALLMQKSYVSNPQIMFGAVGDASFDPFPLQLGEFESGNQMDSCLTNLLLLGGGGSNEMESYDLAMFYMDKCVKMDCWEKRGKKGYLFLVGDENPYPQISLKHIKDVLNMQSKNEEAPNIPVEKIIASLNEKYHLFFITPSGTTYANNTKIVDRNMDLFGERYLRLENPENICELIAMTIGVTENYQVENVCRDLAVVGVDSKSIVQATKSVSGYSAFIEKSKVKGNILETLRKNK